MYNETLELIRTFKAWLNREPVSLDHPDGFKVYSCCNHCFDERGELTHPRNSMDMHTVPCNERRSYCSQNPQPNV